MKKGAENAVKFTRDKRCPWPPYTKHLVRDKILSVVTRVENLAQQIRQNKHKKSNLNNHGSSFKSLNFIFFSFNSPKF